MYNSTLSDGKWHAMCVTWSSVDGHLAVYRDDKKTDGSSNVKTGENVTGGGTWVLGQDQDSVGGGFAIVDSFQGEFAEINIWRRVLTAEEISNFSKNCGRRMNGEVKSWPDFENGLKGQVQIVRNRTCNCKYWETGEN